MSVLHRATMGRKSGEILPQPSHTGPGMNPACENDELHHCTDAVPGVGPKWNGYTAFLVFEYMPD